MHQRAFLQIIGSRYGITWHLSLEQVAARAHAGQNTLYCFLQELLDKCHPLGMFDSIATLAVAQNMRELYRLVLVDTPLAPYFSENLTHEDLDEMNIEVGAQTAVEDSIR